MVSSATLAAPSAPPDLRIPVSDTAVDVRVLDTGTFIKLDPHLFWQPVLPGFYGLEVPIYCFLVSHGDRHVLFDLGVRTDWKNYAPATVGIIEATTTITTGTDVASMLDAHADSAAPGAWKVRRENIEAMVWSHNHFDHVGDPTTFPPHTKLVVGPGVTELSWPGYPTHPDSKVLDSDRAGRDVLEITFDHSDKGLRIGRFAAYDYFGDGSFYLLDAPGHAVGHLCALARVSAGPDSKFIFMGADACHHPAVLRPTEWMPLPKSISPSPLPQLGYAGVCPGEVLQQCIPTGDPSQPFLKVANSILFPDYPAATDTVHKMHELDSDDRIFVLIAHDLSVRDQITMFPNTINDWSSRGLKEGSRWLFCSDFETALREKTTKSADGKDVAAGKQGGAKSEVNGHVNGYVNGSTEVHTNGQPA